jgi:6-phosphogluconolactonase
MKLLALTALATLISLGAHAADTHFVYFGTYTGAKTGSKGIYVAPFDAKTGNLGQVRLAAELERPSFLTIHPNGKHLYAVGEISGGAGVTAYRIDAATGRLQTINQSPAVGSGPCHISLDQTGRMAMIANYGSGSVVSYQIRQDGSLSDPISFIQHEGSSVHPKRQAGPHAHSINASPDNRYAYACDLGLDEVLIYQIDPATGTLTPNNPPFAKVAPGGGPRHFAFHPNGRFAFVNNEMTLTETAFAYDADTGALTEIETVSTLPEADRGQTGMSTAETVAHPNGKFLYVSNRSHDTIAVFACDPDTGKLTLIQNARCEGSIPRNFNLDPSGRWMIIAHQKTNDVAVFAVDPDTGKLSFSGTRIEVGAPVCVRFLEIGK